MSTARINNQTTSNQTCNQESIKFDPVDQYTAPSAFTSQQDKFISESPILIPLDKNGDTYLHCAVRNCSNYSELNSILKFNSTLSPVQIEIMSKIVNNDNKIPIEIIKERTIPAKDKLELINYLMNLTTSIHLPPLNEKIESKQIIDKFGSSELTSALNKNLLLACAAVNYARSIIKTSYTHPQINNRSLEEKIEIGNGIEDARRTKYRNFYPNLTTNSEAFKNLIMAYKKEGKGDCSELARTAFYYCLTTGVDAKAEVINTPKGDHAFLFIGRSTDIFKNDENGVVADPWSMQVFPIKNLHLNLMTNRTYLDKDKLIYASFLASYNPKIHHFEIELKQKELQKFFQNNLGERSSQLGVFAHKAGVCDAKKHVTFRAFSNRIL